MSIVSDHSVGQIDPKLVHSVGQTEEPEGYARLVKSVLFDPELSHCDKLVFAMLAWHVWQGSVAKVGQRAMARDLRMSRTQVGMSLKRLIDRGHIQPAGTAIKAVQMYHLTSTRFGQKQRAAVEEVISSPSKGRRLASVKTA